MLLFFFFFFNDTATTEIYTLSLHDALPISSRPSERATRSAASRTFSKFTRRLHGLSRSKAQYRRRQQKRDRKSTRLNSSHTVISYAVFCLKKKTIISLWNSSAIGIDGTADS